MIKNKPHSIEYTLGFLRTTITIFTGLDSFKIDMEERQYPFMYELNEIKEDSGKMLDFIRDSGSQEIYVYGNNLQVLVHELSHTVTSIMERYNIQDDEFRSYMLDFLYGLCEGKLNERKKTN